LPLASSEAKQIMAAGMRLLDKIRTLKLEEERAMDIVRLARTLATSDYATLREEVKIAARARGAHF
jgi:hypothetical protein